VENTVTIEINVILSIAPPPAYDELFGKIIKQPVHDSRRIIINDRKANSFTKSSILILTTAACNF
jgi:hypothetical protein